MAGVLLLLRCWLCSISYEIARGRDYSPAIIAIRAASIAGSAVDDERGGGFGGRTSGSLVSGCCGC